jgi:FkbH-like protein
MANELALLPESFVFVDDNPAEREIVGQQVPGVAIPQLDKVEHYIKMIDRSGYFEVTNLSTDDFKRNTMYKENAERSKLEASYDNYEDYLLSLNMKALIKSFEPMYMSRIAQLTNKSNQFNLTTRRYNQEEIEATATDNKYITLYGKLEDKFGDNGVVTVTIGEIQGQTLNMVLWLMSCRVLKRDMEYAMMDELIKRCKERSITEIKGYYYPTSKNAMVKNFYSKQGFAKIFEDEAGNTVWSFVISDDYKRKNNVIAVNPQE